MYIGFPKNERYVVTRWIFLKILACTYVIAFCSLGVQITGLVGSKGILPAVPYLKAIRQLTVESPYLVFPTLSWLNASDAFLVGQCIGGAFLSVGLLLGFVQPLVLALLWVLYLSLFTIGREFLSFQWDILLLETGFLAIFFAPLTLKPKSDRFSPPSAIMLFLLRWLLFRLMLSSGLVKLMSGDTTWRNLTALTFYYETQPIPMWTSWYAHHLPVWFHKLSAAGMFFIELAAPIFIFLTRRFRMAAAVLFLFLQGLIAVTGNYGFFNILTIGLVILLLDDRRWPLWLRRHVVPDERIVDPVQNWRWPRWVLISLTAVIFFLSSDEFLGRIGIRFDEHPALHKIQAHLAPFQLTNSYGLFAVMTTSRPEIIVEGSNDGENWKAYEFKYKAGDLTRPPPVVAPHMPRLDWQMWFAALGTFERNPWFRIFCARLLEGNPHALRLLKHNPFPDSPPRYIRAIMYDYHFTSPLERKETGNWWKRENARPYSPVLSLK